MIKLQLGAEGLARSRFAVSPVSETVNLLVAAATGTAPAPLRPRLRETIVGRRLDLLAALLRIEEDAGHYIPDFISPHPAGFEGDAVEELHAVATTPAWRVAGELAVAVQGEQARTVGRTLPRRLTETDEGETSEQLAKELEQVWLRVLAPDWSRVRARMEADITERMRTLARHGFGAAIDTLDRRIDWRDGAVRVDSRFEVGLDEPYVIFLPSVFATRATTVIDPVVACDPPARAADPDPPRPNPHRRATMLFYPVARHTPGSAPQAARPDELIGRTRARILAAVADPATTGEVAGRLRLSPSTVSYHLQILHRAGLVRRTRDVRSVLYQSTRAAG